MKTATIKVLGAATVLVAAGAWYASYARNSSTASGAGSALAVPGLRDTINDVATVSVTTKDGTVTLERGEDGWTLAEKGGYPARAEKVRELLFALRDARVIEEKTADKAKFDKLGLEDPAADDATSKRVVVTAKSGETLCDVLIGDRRFAKGGFGPGQVRPDDQTYLHPAGDGPALLVEGSFTADARAAGWLEQEFLNVDQKRLAAVRVRHAGGEAVELAREDMAASTLEVLGVPEGKEVKTPDPTRPFLSALARLRFDDVAKAETITWDGDGLTTAEFFTEHGLRVVAETVQRPKEGEEVAEGAEPTMVTWAKFRADVVDPAEAPSAPTTDAMGPEAPAPASDEVAGEDDAATEPAGPSADELAQEAAELNAKLAGWAFALPTWKSGPFRMAMDGLVQDIPEPEAEEAEAPEGGEGDGDGL